NPDLATLAVETKIAFAQELDRIAHAADPRVKAVTGATYSDRSGFVRVASTKGLDRSYRASAIWAGVQPLLLEEGQHKNYGLLRAARGFAELDPAWMAREAVRRCVEKLGAREIQGGDLPVVFAPEAFAALLGTFAAIFSAEVAQEGKSLLRAKRSKRVAANGFTLIDDPLEPGGFGSRPFDDEGCPSRPFVLIGDGIFHGFLHNTSTARREGTITTGHATRGGYAGTMRVGTTNLVVKPGVARREDLLASAPRVVEVTEVTGLHAGANTISGDFSLQAQGFLHEAGERTPIHLFTVSGNFYDALEAIRVVGKDVEALPSGIRTPSILVDRLAIAGK
ncbi:MAG: TldD/PmbA family protein, partial [Cyanobacteria bacterium REEB65]|nr:TldD/PmbA family protein [Cyanobacteria bacterium REEB65]